MDDSWRHFQSPHFELYSDEGESASRDLLYNLELLRAVFTERLHFVERARLDVTVYCFNSRRDFRAYSSAGQKKRRIGGFYLAGPDRAIISLAPTDGRLEAQRVVFHEYVHHLFRSAEENPPTWFNEGMAELLASVRIEGDQVEIGRPLGRRLIALHRDNLLSLSTLFAVEPTSQIYGSDDHAGIFYAESWALLHYWYFGNSGLPAKAVEKFIQGATGDNRPKLAALRAYFRQCFGMDYPEMQHRLERYVRTGSYRYSKSPRPDLDDRKTYAMRPVERNEIETRLAELAVRVDHSPIGRLVLLREAGRPQPDPRVLATLGADAAASGDEARAIDYWEQAIKAGSQNVALYRELALSECRQWFHDFHYELRLPSEVSARLRARLMRAIEHEPEQSAAYEMLAWVEAFATDRSIANVNLVQSHFHKLERRAYTLVALAVVRARLGQPDQALKLLKSIDSFDPDPWTAQAAEVVVARLENRPVQRLSQTRDGIETAAEARKPVKSRLRLPSVPVPEDL